MATQTQIVREAPEVEALKLGLMESTKDLINLQFFEKMSPHSSFINIGRGSTVNEKDLVSALDKNLFCRAILDVSKVEPIEESSILLNNSKIKNIHTMKFQQNF